MSQELTFVIDSAGDMKFLVPEFMSESPLLEGANISRASHVEPDNFVLRIIFHGLRQVLGDKGRMSEFTRNWPIRWRVNTKPVGGPILAGRWRNRKDAIDAEIKFLNSWFIGE
jgi:hypothetical protein